VNTVTNRLLYLDGDLLQKYIKHTHDRTEQEVYTWMTTSEMGFPVTQEREEVQCWWDVVEDKTVTLFLAPVITDYIRGLEDKGKFFFLELLFIITEKSRTKERK
jgi:hypothetical protein